MCSWAQCTVNTLYCTPHHIVTHFDIYWCWNEIHNIRIAYKQSNDFILYVHRTPYTVLRTGFNSTFLLIGSMNFHAQYCSALEMNETIFVKICCFCFSKCERVQPIACAEYIEQLAFHNRLQYQFHLVRCMINRNEKNKYNEISIFVRCGFKRSNALNVDYIVAFNEVIFSFFFFFQF